MKRFDFIRVSDNNNPKDFIILQMNKPDLRISMLLCEYKSRGKQTKKYNELYRYFNLDYSWYSVKRIYLEAFDKEILNNILQYLEQFYRLKYSYNLGENGAD